MATSWGTKPIWMRFIRTPMVAEILADREDDLAAVALWLASDESRFVTGTDVVVVGGSTAGPFRRS